MHFQLFQTCRKVGRYATTFTATAMLVTNKKLEHVKAASCKKGSLVGGVVVAATKCTTHAMITDAICNTRAACPICGRNFEILLSDWAGVLSESKRSVLSADLPHGNVMPSVVQQAEWPHTPCHEKEASAAQSIRHARYAACRPSRLSSGNIENVATGTSHAAARGNSGARSVTGSSGSRIDFS